MGECKDCVVGLLGSCRRDGDYCRMERETLMEEARLVAATHGHVLGEFVQVKNYSVWEARCGQCGRAVSIDIDPAVNSPAMRGDATETPCEAAAESEAAETAARVEAADDDDVAPWDRPL